MTPSSRSRIVVSPTGDTPRSSILDFISQK
jgi:hypothetical protein